ncbi:MAG: flagellar biosynthesis protein FlhA, partial [Verrucomicrobiota bacterium]|nr:flagellar biosynthesis protein FlhA [Verrucomicrobiota bacterium]
LGINVASTRLILGEAQAGQIIQKFGEVVVQGNYVVGFVVFLILTIINFVVITKGAGRIAEVAARFTLDAMPGKQMAIDAELNAGLIKEEQARRRRDDLSKEADFYGSMDGASKFVRGDAVAGIIITLVNILGGIGIGVIQRGMDVSTALETYTILSIGDGLVSQIPALVISTAAGILVTRAADNQSLGQTLVGQLFFQPRVLKVLSFTLLILAAFSLITGVLPWFPFTVLGLLLFFMNRTFERQGLLVPRPASGPDIGPDAGPDGEGGDAGPDGEGGDGDEPESLDKLLALDNLQIELGYGLLSLADPKKGGDILERVTGVRRNFVSDMGFIIPAVRLRDNLELGPNEYRFLFRGNVIAKGEVMPGYWLAMQTNDNQESLPGVQTTEPVFGLPATWVTEVERKNAEVAGYSVVDAGSVLVTHFSETIKRYGYQILSRQDVQVLLDNLKDSNPALVNELVPGLLNVGQVQRVLQNLLAEGVSIRNLVSVLERVSDYAATTKNPDELAEQARRAIGAQIVKPFQDEQGAVAAVTLDPWLEEDLVKGLRTTQNETLLLIEPKMAEHLTHHYAQAIQPLLAEGASPVVICSGTIRSGLRKFFAAKFPELAFLSYEELPPKVEIVPVATVPSLS